MSEQKIAELNTRVKTIKNISANADTRELCDIITVILSSLDRDKRDMGFVNTKTKKDAA